MRTPLLYVDAQFRTHHGAPRSTGNHMHPLLVHKKHRDGSNQIRHHPVHHDQRRCAFLVLEIQRQSAAEYIQETLIHNTTHHRRDRNVALLLF